MASARVSARDAQERFWDRHWRAWLPETWTNSWARRRADIVLRFLQFLHLSRPRILDLGCGTGAIAHVLRERGFLILTTPNRFVVDHLADSVREAKPGLFERCLGVRALKRVLSGWFSVLRIRTVVPMGDRGFLRLVNAPRIDRALGSLVSQRRLEALKERARLGRFQVVLAQAKPSMERHTRTVTSKPQV